MQEQKCDFCNDKATKDAQLLTTKWAYVCDRCFDMFAAKAPGTFTTLANIGKKDRKPYSD